MGTYWLLFVSTCIVLVCKMWEIKIKKLLVLTKDSKPEPFFTILLKSLGSEAATISETCQNVQGTTLYINMILWVCLNSMIAKMILYNILCTNPLPTTPMKKPAPRWQNRIVPKDACKHEGDMKTFTQPSHLGARILRNPLTNTT